MLASSFGKKKVEKNKKKQTKKRIALFDVQRPMSNVRYPMPARPPSNLSRDRKRNETKCKQGLVVVENEVVNK